jgi:hypothetical protein
MNDRVVRVLTRPAGWLGFQLTELLVLGLLIRLLVPSEWSHTVQVGVVLPVLIAVVIVNYRIRRRLPPFMATPSRRPPAESD